MRHKGIIELYNAIDDVYHMGKRPPDEQIAEATHLTPRDIALPGRNQTPPSTEAHKLFAQGGTNT